MTPQRLFETLKKYEAEKEETHDDEAGDANLTVSLPGLSVKNPPNCFVPNLYRRQS